MGVFSGIFGNNKEKKESFITWTPLTSLHELEEIKKQSLKQPIAIFKHSTRCSISSIVIKRFAGSFDVSLKNFKVYYLDLITYREISNEVAYQFEVIHQSPQLLVVKNGVVLAHASHYEITQIDLKKF
ncbi:bacillithiol system redox-active protein YtxJ [Tenacibaculum aestuariivivum]|uniref:bacillithiol system redox-active protein YtxJ n=1 Tax=Tenacibaculum aestuariivivum TaxID=2006131 RepID=UPI003AB1BBB6